VYHRPAGGKFSEIHNSFPFLLFVSTFRFSSSHRVHLPTALTHFKFDSTILSLDDLYKGLSRDQETYYFLWVAVHKVLEDQAANVTKLDIFPFSSFIEKKEFLFFPCLWNKAEADGST
jgi:hypothetical protein